MHQVKKKTLQKKSLKSLKISEMYALNPILVDQKIALPGCMYKIKPVNAEQAANMEQSKNNSVKSFSRNFICTFIDDSELFLGKN